MKSLTKTVIQIDGMHCNSCALNIDFDLEDLPGVKSSKTSYAKQLSEVEYDQDKLSLDQIQKQIQKTGYRTKS